VDFLCFLRAQLAKDRELDADCTPLYLFGSIGSLFKIRLSAYGFTLVAKGVETGNIGRLRHEKDVYDQMYHIQGRHIPVCLGLMEFGSVILFGWLLAQALSFKLGCAALVERLRQDQSS